MPNQMLNDRLREYLKAEQKILLGGQSYTIENITYTRANIGEIRKAIDDLIAAGATVTDTAVKKNKRSRQIVFAE